MTKQTRQLKRSARKNGYRLKDFARLIVLGSTQFRPSHVAKLLPAAERWLQRKAGG